MDILAWVVFGLIVGLIANAVDQRPSKGGLLGAMVLGIIGAMFGGFLGNMFFGLDVTGFNVQSFIVAVIGSLLVLYIGRAFKRA